MNDEQFKNFKEEMWQHTEGVIRSTVNGKVDKLTHKLDEYIAEDMRWKDGDKEWKAEAQPLVDAFKGGSWFMKTLIAILKFLGLLTVGAGFIKIVSESLHK